jgi:hypothetical protein
LTEHTEKKDRQAVEEMTRWLASRQVQGAGAPLDELQSLREQLSQVEKERDEFQASRNEEVDDWIRIAAKNAEDGLRRQHELESRLSSLSEKLEGLVKEWRQIVEQEDNDEWGRERASVRTDDADELSALLVEEPLRTPKQEKDKT